VIQQIATNAWVVVASYIVGILGIFLSFAFYFAGREQFTMIYRVCERTLLSPKSRSFDMDIPVLFDGREITKLTRSYVLIENIGNKLMEAKDIVERATIKIANGSSINRTEVVHADDPGSQLQITADETIDNVREIKFDFLRVADSFIIVIDHTGSTSELFVECNTKAGGAIRDPSSDAPMEPLKYTGLLLLLGSIGSAIVLTIEGNLLMEASVA
jgi:hypothetical protein